MKLILGLILLPLMVTSCASENSRPVPTENNSSAIAQSDFSSLLLELESNVGWGAVNAKWRETRDSWVVDCKNAKNITDKADLLMEFESVVEWSAVDQRWSGRRDAWLQDCISATSDAELAKYLTEFETYILWEAVSPNWASVREDWIKRCGKL